MIGSPSSHADGCRVAPYVNMPSMRLAFDRIHMQHLSHFDTPAGAAAAAAAAAVAAVTGVSPLAAPPAAGHPPISLPTMLFYPTPHYAMNLALAQGNLSVTKNSSIADLRLKAKKHAAALGL